MAGDDDQAGKHAARLAYYGFLSLFPLGTQIEGSIRISEGSGVGLVVGILGTMWGGLGIAQSAARLPGPRRDRRTR
jgi:hypothetical protein